ncbi:tetratricopeptide repeat protein [Legionella yabuuchiae]|uniref:tetratricopeptide repeat protein n=1 Tax=Legionella yabuuchiae TaxID=376727 RepID=UPI0010560157|nr:tetratricopeptide repeat protein [Legionella yabuuchiae]
MSLLNEMLKDLSENKSNVKPTLTFIPPQQSATKIRFLKGTVWCISILALSFIIILILKGFKSPESFTRPTRQIQLNQAKPSSASVRYESSLVNIPYHELAQPKLSRESISQSSKPDTKLPPPLQALPSSLVSIKDFEQQASRIKPAILDYEEKNRPIVKKKKTHVEKVFNELSDEQWHDYTLNKALTAVQDGEDYKAIQLLNQVIFKFPTSLTARESLAAVYMSNGQLGKAMQVLDEGLSFKPKAMGLSTMKARLLFEQDKAAEALKILSQFTPDIYRNPDFYGLLAAVYQTVDRTKEAGSLYQKLVEIDPSNGQYWLGYGIALEHRNATQQAVSAYRRASESYELDPAVRAYAESRLKLLQG